VTGLTFDQFLESENQDEVRKAGWQCRRREHDQIPVPPETDYGQCITGCSRVIHMAMNGRDRER
jgi:hypothetical protein